MTDGSEHTPIVSYGPCEDGEYMIFYRICPKCGRFVKADNSTKIPEYQGDSPNASCKRCGRVQMPFAIWDYREEMEMAYGEHDHTPCW